jgi:alpha-methylacyl-CoA racemase
MAVGALERKFWVTLCDILGCPELKDKHIVYGADAEPVKTRLAKIFATRTQKEWTGVLAGADCCVSPVLVIGESLGNEQLRARGMVVGDGELRQLAPPLKLSDFEFAIERQAPAAGQHTEEILREAGYGDADIAALRREGVI